MIDLEFTWNNPDNSFHSDYDDDAPRLFGKRPSIDSSFHVNQRQR